MKLGLADLYLPQPCIGCGILTRGGLCRVCVEAAPRVGPDICQRCGAPMGAPHPTCRHCENMDPSFDRARQSFLFEGVIRRAIHRFKYTAETAVLEPLLDAVDLALFPTCDAICWVPISRERLVRRGCDHARLIADGIAERLGILCVPLLARARTTKAQVGLAPSERKANMSGAFAAIRPTPPNVVVIDDVFTTGATADACASALKSGGATHIDVFSIARALPDR